MAGKIQIIEVGPRDGLQNEKQKLDLKVRYELIKRLSDAGLRRIEVGAFVSPKWVPQMAKTEALVEKVLKAQESSALSSGAEFSVLVPNARGMQDAVASGIKEIAVFGACSESFSKKNINCTINESFERFSEVIRMAKRERIRVRGYLSTAFGCPYEGKVSEARVVRLTERMLNLGVYEVSIGDTIGVATPKSVRSLVPKLIDVAGVKKLAMHFHDTRGTALANVLASLDLDIRRFDSSLGGLGGCPYAKGASGNLATEDLIYMLDGMGYKTGVDISKLIEATRWIQPIIGRSLPSKLGAAGLPW